MGWVKYFSFGFLVVDSGWCYRLGWVLNGILGFISSYGVVWGLYLEICAG